MVRDTGIKNYNESVRNGTFPDPDTESYSMDPEEWAGFLISRSSLRNPNDLSPLAHLFKDNLDHIQ